MENEREREIEKPRREEGGGAGRWPGIVLCTDRDTAEQKSCSWPLLPLFFLQHSLPKILDPHGIPRLDTPIGGVGVLGRSSRTGRARGGAAAGRRRGRRAA